MLLGVSFLVCSFVSWSVDGFVSRSVIVVPKYSNSHNSLAAPSVFYKLFFCHKILVQPWTGPEGSSRFRFLDFKTIGA